MPLSRYGLCDALMTAARSKPCVAISSGAPGVGRTPPRKHVAAGGRDARRERGLEHLARLAGVADDEHPGVLRADLLDGRAAQRERELGGEQLTGDAADAIRAEQPPSHALGLGAG